MSKRIFKLSSAEYEVCKRWFERSLDLIWRMPAELRRAFDPMEAIESAENVSPAKAAKSLSAGIADTVGMTDRYSADDVKALDLTFAQEDLPTLSFFRALLSKDVNRILKRGRVETEDEFYDLKAVEDCSFDGGTTEEIGRLIADYEASVERGGSS